MEPEMNNNFSSFREEEGNKNNLWYIIGTALLILLIGWYGYSAGWFSPRGGDDLLFIGEDAYNNTSSDELNTAQVDSFDIRIDESFPVQVFVNVQGHLNDGCTVLETPAQVRDGNVFYINLDTRTEGEMCTQALVPYEINIPLAVTNLPAGVYIVNVNGQERSFELTSNNTLDFTAGSDK